MSSEQLSMPSQEGVNLPPELSHDQKLDFTNIEPGGETQIEAQRLESLAEAHTFPGSIGEGAVQRLRSVIRAGDQTFNIVESSSGDSRGVRYVTHASGRREPADIIGQIGSEGLVVYGETAEEGVQPLFRVAFDQEGNLHVLNNDRLDVAVGVMAEPTPSFNDRSIWRALKALVPWRRPVRPVRAYTSGVDWAARSDAVGMMGAEQQQVALSASSVGMQREFRESTPEGRRFWAEGYAQSAQTFDQQIEQLSSNPEARTNIVRSSPSGVLKEDVAHSQYRFTERDGLQDLASYLDRVRQVAAEPGDTQMLQEVATFREHFSFLGQAEFNQACAGIAEAWLEYVSQSPNHVINVYNDTRRGRRSYNLVLDTVVNEFRRLTQDMPVGGRVRTSPQDWQHTNESKLVVIDDWMLTGNTAEMLLGDAVGEARKNGKYQLGGQLEVHALFADGAQIATHQMPSGEGQYNVRAYYRAPKETLNYQTAPSGAHSSTDYGFEMVLERFKHYMISRGEAADMPLLTYVAREYRDEDAVSNPRQQELLAELARLNGDALLARQQISQAMRAQDTMVRQGGWADINEPRSQQHAAAERLANIDSMRGQVREEYWSIAGIPPQFPQ